MCIRDSSSTRPVLVRLEEPKKTVLPSLTAPEEEGEKAVEARDEAFRDFIKAVSYTHLCEYGPENLKITTIENYEKRIPIARENFRKAGRESQIEFLTGMQERS